MEIDNLHEFESESELAPLVCPNCATEVESEPWPQACPRCQRPFDLQAQFAYCRGLDAFSVGQELIIQISPRKRQRDLTTKEEMEGLQYYLQAYSSLQQAFQGELAESQRQLGIKMMASMAQVFQQHGMVSPLEAAYWVMLLTELNSHLERVSLTEKLAQTTPGGISSAAQRWRWRARKRQLEKALVELGQKIRILERSIAFIERPHTRRQTR